MTGLPKWGRPCDDEYFSSDTAYLSELTKLKISADNYRKLGDLNAWVYFSKKWIHLDWVSESVGSKHQ